MNKLYIVGNGFDLAHDLKTSYKDFYDFLKKYDLPSDLKQYVKRMQSRDILLNKFSHESEKKEYFWTEWERSFNASGTTPYIIDFSKNKSLKIKNDFIYFLNKWIIETVNTSLSECNQKYNFDDNGLFLSFNYSDTLEKVYSVNSDDITYIHGKSQNLESNLIFGSSYSLDPVDFPNPKKEEFRRKNSIGFNANSYKEYIAMPDSISTPAPELVQAFYKDINKYIDQHHLKTKYKDIEEIYIIGHSIGHYSSKLSFLDNNSNIDDGYYEFLLKNLSKLQTIVVYEHQNSAQNKIERLKTFNSNIAFKVKDNEQ